MSDDAVIARISAYCIPAAVNLYVVRRAQDAGGELFRSVQKQIDQYQGLWLVSPAGKAAAAHHDFQAHDRQGRAKEVLEFLDAGLAALGEIDPREAQPLVEPLPHRGLGLAADGDMVLAMYARYIHQGKPDGPVVHDSLKLTGEQVRHLTPSSAAPGRQWTAPESVAGRFCRGLSPHSDQSTMPLPDEVTRAELQGQVTAVADGVASIRYSGHIAAAHVSDGRTNHGEAEIVGVGSYDVRSSRLLSFTLLLEGEYRHFPPYDDPRRFGAVFEWRRDRAPLE